jgi:hypothetical protein
MLVLLCSTGCNVHTLMKTQHTHTHTHTHTQGGYPQASSYPAPASSAYSAPQRGYAPPAYNAGAAPAPSAYGGLGGV